MHLLEFFVICKIKTTQEKKKLSSKIEKFYLLLKKFGESLVSSPHTENIEPW